MMYKKIGWSVVYFLVGGVTLFLGVGVLTVGFYDLIVLGYNSLYWHAWLLASALSILGGLLWFKLVKYIIEIAKGDYHV